MPEVPVLFLYELTLGTAHLFLSEFFELDIKSPGIHRIHDYVSTKALHSIYDSTSSYRIEHKISSMNRMLRLSNPGFARLITNAISNIYIYCSEDIIKLLKSIKIPYLTMSFSLSPSTSSDFESKLEVYRKRFKSLYAMLTFFPYSHHAQKFNFRVHAKSVMNAFVYNIPFGYGSYVLGKLSSHTLRNSEELEDFLDVFFGQSSAILCYVSYRKRKEFIRFNFWQL